MVVVATPLVNKQLFRAQKWFASNSKRIAKAYVGKWIAVSSNGIKSSARSLKALEQKVGGRTDLILTKVPKNLGAVCCYYSSP